MGVKRFEVHFQAIFLTDHKVASNRAKIASASHDDIYVIICVNILSAGVRQELGRTSAGTRQDVGINSAGRRQEKIA